MIKGCISKIPVLIISHYLISYHSDILTYLFHRIQRHINNIKALWSRQRLQVKEGNRSKQCKSINVPENIQRVGRIKVQHNRNGTTKIRSQNHLGLLDWKKNDDAFAEVIVYKIYMSLVYGPILWSLCVIKEGTTDGTRIEEKPEGCQRGKRTRSWV